MYFRSSECWQLLIYVFPSDSTPLLHFLHYMTVDWCWYCSDILVVLRPVSESSARSREVVCWGRVFVTDGLFVLGAGYHPKSGRKAADYPWWMKTVCTTVAVVASRGPSVITWMLRFAFYKIYSQLKEASGSTYLLEPIWKRCALYA